MRTLSHQDLLYQCGIGASNALPMFSSAVSYLTLNQPTPDCTTHQKCQTTKTTFKFPTEGLQAPYIFSTTHPQPQTISPTKASHHPSPQAQKPRPPGTPSQPCPLPGRTTPRWKRQTPFPTCSSTSSSRRLLASTLPQPPCPAE